MADSDFVLNESLIRNAKEGYRFHHDSGLGLKVVPQSYKYIKFICISSAMFLGGLGFTTVNRRMNRRALTPASNAKNKAIEAEKEKKTEKEKKAEEMHRILQDDANASSLDIVRRLFNTSAIMQLAFEPWAQPLEVLNPNDLLSLERTGFCVHNNALDAHIAEAAGEEVQRLANRKDTKFKRLEGEPIDLGFEDATKENKIQRMRLEDQAARDRLHQEDQRETQERMKEIDNKYEEIPENETNGYVRDDRVLFLGNDPPELETNEALQVAVSVIEAVGRDIMKVAKLNETQDLQLAIFEPYYDHNELRGARFSPHIDAFPSDGRIDKFWPEQLEHWKRHFTVILYLNSPDWALENGGCLRIHCPSDLATLPTEAFKDIPPVGGRIVVYMSGAVTTEVMPSYGVRVDLTSFLY